MSWDLPTQTLTSTSSSTPLSWELFHGISSPASTTSLNHTTSFESPKPAHTSTATITTVAHRAEVRQVSPSPNSARSGWFARWWMTPRGRRTVKADEKKMEHTVSDMAYKTAVEAQATKYSAKNAIGKRELEGISMYWGPFSSGTAPTSPATTPVLRPSNSTSSSTPFRPLPEAGNLNDGPDGVDPATSSSSSIPLPSYSWPSTHGSPTASYHSPAPQTHSFQPSTTGASIAPVESFDSSCVFTTTTNILPLDGGTSAVEVTQTWTGCWVPIASGYSSNIVSIPAHSTQHITSLPASAAPSSSTSAAASSLTFAAISPISAAISSPTSAAAPSLPASASKPLPTSAALPPSTSGTHVVPGTTNSQTPQPLPHHSPASPSSPPSNGSASPSSSSTPSNASASPPSTPSSSPLAPSILATPTPTPTHQPTLPEWLPFTPPTPLPSDLAASKPAPTTTTATTTSNAPEKRFTWMTWFFWSIAILMGVTNVLQLRVDVGGLPGRLRGLGEVLV
ncbi:uncharacterized protein BDZ99DRAFT_574912 [Mytilinidion resinicola]|uniref:Uncharacterized protein n=1 Tax=Mytilinidion resinicola TaxID=574789 RepID=A0A6A6Y9W6_9PEZI|nr:uncharacterized protein BDZ99DRAFT_574912 [Mytilinidion resinicola]KAF2805323.1 hypothetical protein BDZ99DRAFT_574912 [Mytilinidion resinicola]